MASLFLLSFYMVSVCFGVCFVAFYCLGLPGHQKRFGCVLFFFFFFVLFRFVSFTVLRV